MTNRPAWSQESMFLQMPDFARLDRFSPEWALEGATGAGVRVAVVDSGIDATHPMLEGCVDTDNARDFSVDPDGNVVITEGNHEDVFGHGTACAGIIHVLAPEARITSVRVLGPGLRGKAAAFHAGLQWAVDEGFDVINLSLGAGKRDWALPFHEVCDRAYFGNTFIVTAANNVQRSSFPSLYASVTSVACNTTEDPLRFHFNPEPPTEFLARGIDVEVPWLNGETTVTTGNSFAAPHIAGFAALIRSKHPELRPFHVKAALWACAANVRNVNEPLDAARGASRVLKAVGRGTVMAAPDALPDVAEPAPPASASPPKMPGSGDVKASDPLAELERELAGVTVSGVLAEGALGTVFRGTRADGEAIAIRRVDQGLAADSSLIGRFVASVRAAAALDHPHVLPIYELVELGSHALIVMPECPSNLSQLEQPIVIEDACLAAMSLLIGLDATHRSGVFHGDVRPRNCLVDRQRRVVISDVGLAAPLQSNASTIVSFDSEEWVHRAPEAAAGQAIGAYGDVYSVGSILYEMLVGTPPRPPVSSLRELVSRAGQPVEVARPPATVPAPIADALMPSLVHEPAYRWSSAYDFYAALYHACQAALGDGWMWRSQFILDGSGPGPRGSGGAQRTYGR